MDVTPDSVGLSWTVPEGKFDSFVVQYKDRAGQPQVVPVATDQREVTVPGLEPNRKYKFLLFGIQDGKRHSSISAEAKTGERAPHEAEPKAQPPHPSSHGLIAPILPGVPSVHFLCVL